MSIKHTFVSPKTEQSDPTLVGPNEWNAIHTIDPATVTYAMLQNVAANNVLLGNNAGAGQPVAELTAAQVKSLIATAPADVTFSTTQRALGRNTAGGGAGEEVTASQILDWVSNTNGVLLTRTGGSWAALANVGTDNGDLLFTENTAPVAPASGKSKVFGASSGGRQMLAMLAPLGAKMLVQPLLAQRAISQYVFIPGGAGSGVGCRFDITGTSTPRSPASGSIATAATRCGYVSAATASSVAGVRSASSSWYRGDVAGAGGFHAVWRFMISDASLVATGRMFSGLQASISSPTDVDPSTFANMLGVGNNNGDANLQLYASGSAAQARTDLGANFPANTTNTDLYEFALYCAPNDTKVTYELKRLNTGDRVTGTISAAASLPSSTTFLTQQTWRGNGGTAAAVGIDIAGFCIDRDS